VPVKERRKIKEWTNAQELALPLQKPEALNLSSNIRTFPFIVITDASKYVVGGILSQGLVGKDHPIAYDILQDC